MPEDLSESVSGSTELVFPDDTTGKMYRVRELVVFDAEEVRDDLGIAHPEYGKWLPVEVLETGLDAYLTAPSQLRTELVQADVNPGERFQIDLMQKQGRNQSDPYQVELSFPDRKAVPEDQASLETATDGSGDR